MTNKDEREPNPLLPLAEALSAAFIKYTEFFGEQPHGTVVQMSALLELMPGKAKYAQVGRASSAVLAAYERTARAVRHLGRDFAEFDRPMPETLDELWACDEALTRLVTSKTQEKGS